MKKGASMDVTGWLSETYLRSQRNGIRGAYYGLRAPYLKLMNVVGQNISSGDDIFPESWDVLVILDACRYDALDRIAGYYDEINPPGTFESQNTATKLWMRDNFRGKYEAEKSSTSYVSGNPFSDTELNDRSWKSVDHVWKHSWSDPGTVLPAPITDTAIRRWRKTDPDRMIVHYMQPHYPYVSDPDIGPKKDVEKFGTGGNTSIWDEVLLGNVNLPSVKKAYMKNLELVLDDITNRLLTNLDAKDVVLTADHGEAFGEWGIYGHPSNSPLSVLRTVPWTQVEASDTRTIEPERLPKEETSIDREDQLQALGYL